MFDDKAQARFWSKVERLGADDCWPWLGPISNRNRGRFSADGVSHPAPRVSLYLKVGPAPEGKPMACHTCDNPNCVNPNHLWWGSNQDNIRDAAAKGRLPLQKKEACKHGHPWTTENIRRNSQGQRTCRECKRIQDRKRHALGLWRSEGSKWHER